MIQQKRRHAPWLPEQGLEHVSGLRRRHPFGQRQPLSPSMGQVIRGSRHAAFMELRHRRPVPFQVVGECGDQLNAIATRFLGNGQQEVLLAHPVVAQGRCLAHGSPLDRRRGHHRNVPLPDNRGTRYRRTGDPPPAGRRGPGDSLDQRAICT